MEGHLWMICLGGCGIAAAYCKMQYRHYGLQPEEDYGNLDQDSQDTNPFTVRFGMLQAVSSRVNRNVLCHRRDSISSTSDSVSAKFSPVDWKLDRSPRFESTSWALLSRRYIFRDFPELFSVEAGMCHEIYHGHFGHFQLPVRNHITSPLCRDDLCIQESVIK
jgi:hypothetical protein